MSGLIHEDEEHLAPSWADVPDEDAMLAGAREPIRNGVISRMAYWEASGWLAFVHAWIDPIDPALRDLGLTGSYAVAIRVGRSSVELPNTAASHAMEPWLELRDDATMSIDQTRALATASAAFAGMTRRLSRPWWLPTDCCSPMPSSRTRPWAAAR
jgi:hypothetical protein